MAHELVIPIAIKSAHGKWLCAEGSSGRVVADRAKLGAWEKWSMRVLDHKTVAIRSCHGRYLCAEPSGKVIANRDALGPWETWHIVPNGDMINLQSCHGKWLCIETKGAVIANRPACGAWEMLQLTDHSGSPRSPTYHLDELRGVEEIRRRLRREADAAEAAVIAAEARKAVMEALHDAEATHAKECAAAARMRLLDSGFHEFVEGNYNIGVVGVKGAGKTTFIRCFRGVPHVDEKHSIYDTAERSDAGINKHVHPVLTHVALWDIPGCEKRETTPTTYWHDNCLDAFDAILLVMEGDTLSPFDKYILTHAAAARRLVIVLRPKSVERVQQIMENKSVTRKAAEAELRAITTDAVCSFAAPAETPIRVFCIDSCALGKGEWVMEEREFLDFLIDVSSSTSDDPTGTAVDVLNWLAAVYTTARR